MGTPDQVWSCMTRCWHVELTSDRIAEDILALSDLLNKIIEVKGCVVLCCIVQDQYLRNSRCARRDDDKDMMQG